MYGIILIMLPTVQVLTTSGTYVPPPTSKYIEVYIIGGSGGGGGGSAGAGGAGGGGPGKTLLAYFPADTYAYVIGSAGAAGATAANGGAGTTTTFNGIASGGGTGGITTSGGATSKSASSTSTTVTGAIRLGSIHGGSGIVINASSNGGTNMFGLDGRGSNSSVGALSGLIGTLFGGGGGGGQGATSVGGAGVKGGCIVVEHY